MDPLFTKFTSNNLNQISSIYRPKQFQFRAENITDLVFFTNCEGLLWVSGGYLAAPSLRDQMVLFSTYLERIYNSHYGNGVPAMFIF